MREFLVFVVCQLVDEPDQIIIREEDEGGIYRYSLLLPPSEVGKVIGKQGCTIRAIRNLIDAAADRQGKGAIFEVQEQNA